jgi:hypothetical protein
MQDFTLHHLRVRAEVETPVLLNQHKGSALRGALFHALRGPDRPAGDGYTGFCTNKSAPSCWECPLHHACPVATLVSTLDARPQSNTHGRYPPRPYVIRPPLDNGKTRYHPGDPFHFDLILCADALQLFPYVIMALERLGHEGLGKRQKENGWRRGRLRLTALHAVHPLTGEIQPIRNEGERMVQIPDLPATHAQVMEAAARLPENGRLTLHFHTPTRLIKRGQLSETPDFRTLFLRLVTRLEQLSEGFSATPLELDVPPLVTLADQVQIVDDKTKWLDLKGYSTRKRRETLLGGLVGSVTYQSDDWTPFRPWLVWGGLLGVGKNTVKGDGWYSIEGRREKEEK